MIDLKTKDMTLRDYFASQAVAGMAFTGEGEWTDPGKLARQAYQIADAMLARRRQPPEKPDKFGRWPVF